MCESCPYPTPGKNSLVRDDLGRKECGKCHHWKYVEHFPKASKTADGLSRTCKSCRADAQRLRFYGLTRERVGEMLMEQGYACAICEKPFAGENYRIDHDHRCCPKVATCGQCVRKILCQDCNSGLGFFKDSKELLLNAIDYLESE